MAGAYGYDFDNRLRTADVDSNATVGVNFQYDALGRRVARQGSSGSFVFVQDGQQTIADYVYGNAPASSLNRYVYASYIDEPVVRKGTGTGGTTHYYHRNLHYSITAVTTSAGAVAKRYAYTAYGQPTILNASASPIASSTISNRYMYTGREWDATLGLYHFRARWMSSLAGRFMGRDPIGYEGSEWDLYEFCKSSPLRFLDPKGLACDDVLDCFDPCDAPTESSDIAEVSSSLMGCLKSPALLKVCIDTGVVQWGNLAARYAGKGDGDKLVKLLEKWGGQIVKGGKGSHTKVRMPDGTIQIVPSSPGNGTVVSILKSILQ